jgi:2-dehydro-3-deoxy-D-arabinonate dehydratase
MKLIQFYLPGKGKRVGVVQGDRVLDITSAEEGVRCTLDLVAQGKTARGVATRASWLAKRLHRRGLDWRELQRPPSRRSPHLLVPIDAPEVWGARGTYAPKDGMAPAAPGPDAPHRQPLAPKGADDFPPALYFKATAHRVVGPHAPIVIREDSALTLPEAGLAAILAEAGAVVAFTACNDVTARDIERRGSEYLSQARIYAGSCALGPCLTTPDEIEDPCGLRVRCSILRAGTAIFSEAASTAGLRWSLGPLVSWLLRDNPVPAGTVLSTGTGIQAPDAAALFDGDQVEIELQGIGRLSNPVRGHCGVHLPS